MGPACFPRCGKPHPTRCRRTRRARRVRRNSRPRRRAARRAILRQTLLGPDGPAFDGHLDHRKITRVPGHEPPAKAVGCGCDQAICLREGATAGCGLPPPLARLPPFGRSERSHSQASEEPASRILLPRKESTHGLLDVDGTDVRGVPRLAKRLEPTSSVSAAAQQVDKDRGIEQDGRHYPTRRSSWRRCARTHDEGSASHSCPWSPMEPSDDSIRSQRRSVSSACSTARAMNELRPRGPTRLSRSRTISSRRTMCTRMCLT
jgi:hypothetical protein